MTASDSKRDARGLAQGVLSYARKNARTIAVLLAALVFVWLLEEVSEGEIMTLDALAYRFFVVTLRSDVMTPIMEGFTSLSSVAVILVMALVVAAFAPGKAPGRCVCANVVGALVLNQVLKFIIQRPRPDGFRLATASGFSFPSGHSMVAMAFFGLLAWLVWKYEADRRLRRLYATGFALVIVMIGVSRIYLGVHYASDVLGGFCLSMAWLAVYTRVAVPLFIGEDDLGSSGEEALRR